MAVFLAAQHFDLETSIIILRGRRSTLDVSCCSLFAHPIVRAASSGDNVQIPWQRGICEEASHETSVLEAADFRVS